MEYKIYSSYKSVETTLTTGNTLTLATNETTLSTQALQRGENWLIRTDQTVTIKFESSSKDGITLTGSEASMSFEQMSATKVVISNASGSTANLKILILGPAVLP